VQISLPSAIKIQKMKINIGYMVITMILISCSAPTQNDQSAKTIIPLEGTWKLLSGTTIEKGVSTVTDYTKDREFIKIINDTHFAFLSHDLNKGKDSAAVFTAGGGSYSLADSLYTEHLEYCNDRQWEGNSFEFTVTIRGDTLTQKGIEKIENIGVNRINIETYRRVKN
jgi:hypothetical protein